TLNTTVNMTVTVNYATSDGTAVAGTNYTAVSGTLTFPANATSEQFSVPITDGGFTTDTSFTVNLSSPSNASIGTSSATVTIAHATPIIDIPSDGTAGLPGPGGGPIGPGGNQGGGGGGGPGVDGGGPPIIFWPPDPGEQFGTIDDLPPIDQGGGGP